MVTRWHDYDMNGKQRRLNLGANWMKRRRRRDMFTRILRFYASKKEDFFFSISLKEKFLESLSIIR